MGRESDPQVVKRLEAALDGLPPLQRLIVLAVRRRDESSYSAIAELFGISVTDVEHCFAEALLTLIRAVDR